MVTQKNEQTTQQEKNNEEMQRLIRWVSKHWDEWKMLCHPAITDTDTKTKRRKWVESLKSFAKADFPALILVFMTKSYYMEGEAKQAVEGAVVQRILSTWDENTIDEFINYLSKVDNWDARDIPLPDERKQDREKRRGREIDNWLNPEG